MPGDDLEGGMERWMGGRFKREGTYAYLWLIHVDVWQKPTQHCNAIILQIKMNIFFKVPLKLTEKIYLGINLTKEAKELHADKY